MIPAPRLLELLPFSAALLLILLLGIHGIMKGDMVPDEFYDGSDIGTENGEETIFPEWMGLDLPELLGPLQTLNGAAAVPPHSGLTLWVLIRDRECIACLDELPLLAAFVDSLNSSRLSVLAVAIGDRHEARRNMWGVETDMPVFVTGCDGVLEALGAHDTPLRALTWYGRIIGLTGLPINTVTGRRALYKLVQMWISE